MIRVIFLIAERSIRTAKFMISANRPCDGAVRHGEPLACLGTKSWCLEASLQNDPHLQAAHGCYRLQVTVVISADTTVAHCCSTLLTASL
jgi:hypothetical protein